LWSSLTGLHNSPFAGCGDDLEARQDGQMLMATNPDEPERPRFEPEIIPPDRSTPDREWPPYGFREARGTQRIYVRQIGPLGFGLILLVVVLLAVVLLLVLIGTALIWIPIAAAVLVIAFISRLLRWL